MIPKNRSAYGTNSFRQKISFRDHVIAESSMMPRVNTDSGDMHAVYEDVVTGAGQWSNPGGGGLIKGLSSPGTALLSLRDLAGDRNARHGKLGL
jgi:hypothetical protein